MSLSENAKKALEVACPQKRDGVSDGKEIADQMDAASAPAAAVADLNQTISNPPTQAEVQAISDKMDELLASMRAAGKLAE